MKVQMNSKANSFNAVRSLLIAPVLMLVACGNGAADARQAPEAPPFSIEDVAHFDQPWAMTFLPDGRALVTEKSGTLVLWSGKGEARASVLGAPIVAEGGQGGLGDVAPHPGFAKNRMIYLSWVESGDGGFGAVVGRAKLVEGAAGPRLEGLSIIWRQSPKVSGRGHFGHRIAFGPDGKLFVSSGDRQKFDPAQDRGNSLGKVMRMNDDGSDPGIWSLGHRNPLGLAFDAERRLWEVEMGPQGGDELNLIREGSNYGWPRASNGSHYGGKDIPDHRSGDGFEAPKTWWTPSISPGSLMIYSGNLFARWKGDAFIGALGGEALIRVDLDGEKALKADLWPMKTRIREVEQGPDGAIWLLEDGANGRLMKVTPKR